MRRSWWPAGCTTSTVIRRLRDTGRAASSSGRPVLRGHRFFPQPWRPPHDVVRRPSSADRTGSCWWRPPACSLPPAPPQAAAQAAPSAVGTARGRILPTAQRPRSRRRDAKRLGRDDQGDDQPSRLKPDTVTDCGAALRRAGELRLLRKKTGCRLSAESSRFRHPGRDRLYGHWRARLLRSRTSGDHDVHRGTVAWRAARSRTR